MISLEVESLVGLVIVYALDDFWSDQAAAGDDSFEGNELVEECAI